MHCLFLLLTTVSLAIEFVTFVGGPAVKGCHSEIGSFGLTTRVLGGSDVERPIQFLTSALVPDLKACSDFGLTDSLIISSKCVVCFLVKPGGDMSQDGNAFAKRDAIPKL